MDPKIVKFIYLNSFVVLVLVGYMLFWRSQRRPTRLKLRQSRLRDKIVSNISSESDNERELNVVFQFNGHDFEAHEVLGLAAGSSVKSAEEAYLKIITKADEESVEIYKLALIAIQKIHQKR